MEYSNNELLTKADLNQTMTRLKLELRKSTSQLIMIMAAQFIINIILLLIGLHFIVESIEPS